MLTKKVKKLMRDYLDSLPLVKERRGTTTYWFLPETDVDDWISFIDEMVCRVVTEVKAQEHPTFGPEIATYYSDTFKDFEPFKAAVDNAMKQAEVEQRKYQYMRKEWKAEHIRDCAKAYEA